MIKYIITSDTFDGEAVISYDENGGRPIFDCHNTNMSEYQHKGMMRWIYERAINHDTIVGTINAGATGKLRFQQMNIEPSFSDFWVRYFKGRYKDNSSKKAAELRWNRMTKGSQLAAYNYIGKYFINVPAGTQPKLAETYLNSEVWVK